MRCRYCNDFCEEKYFCKVYRCKTTPDNRKCPPEEWKLKMKSFNCYLTTAMCDILHKPDDCFELEALRGFRENYLRRTSQGVELLKEYDEIGPRIASKLLAANHREEIAKTMLADFILLAIEKIQQEKNEEAVIIYQNMVTWLRERL